MARRRSVTKRVGPVGDSKYSSALVNEFINCIMRCGQKRTAERILYGAIDIVAQKTGQEGLSIFKKAVENVRPSLEVKSRRIGGANYQIPIEVAPERKNSLAIRWIITFSKERPENGMAEQLANELIQASKNEGASVRKKIDMHKMAEANKAFAHFNW